VARSPEWQAAFDTLSEREQRRALAAPVPVANRLPGEKLYPVTGWLADYVLLYQESEAPLGWHFWSGVALLSVVARRNFYWDRGNYFLLLNHYLFLLGASGGRKSTTFNCARDLWSDVELLYGDGIEPVYVSPNRITTGRLLKDLTNWATALPNRRDTIVFIANDELASLLGKAVQGSDRLADFVTDAYMGKDRWKDSTLSGGDRELRNLAVTCLLASTASSVRRNITEGMFEEGFMGRLLTIARFGEQHGVYPTPQPVDPAMRRMLAGRLHRWLSLDREIVVVPDREAAAWYDEWYVRHHTAGPPSDAKLASFWSRKHDHMLRLAGVLALSEEIAHREPADLGDRLVVALPTLLKALEVLEDEERRLPAAYAEIGAKEEARDQWRVEELLRRWCEQHEQWYPHGELHRNTLYITGTRRRFGEIMESLVEQGVVEQRTVPTAGRPGVFYKPTGLRFPEPR
jgi:hypothetical protein